MAPLKRSPAGNPGVFGLTRGTPRRTRESTGSWLNRSLKKSVATGTPSKQLKQFGLRWTWVLLDPSTPSVESRIGYGLFKGSRCRAVENKKRALNTQRRLKKCAKSLRVCKALAGRLQLRIEALFATLEKANNILQIDLDKDVHFEHLLERVRVCINALE